VWETHFRETAAHNTARVDGRDQARHLGKMAWSHSYRARPEGWQASGREAWAVGAHDGYDRGPEGVTHRRAAWLRDGGYVIVCDEFVGQGAHDLEVNFQFAPGAPLVQVTDGVVAFGDVATLHWFAGVRWTPQLADGGDGPAAGWIAPSLGVKQAAPRLTLRCRSDAPRTTLLTVLVPGGETGRALDVRREGDSATVVVTGPGFADHVSAPFTDRERRSDEALVEVRRVDESGAAHVSRLPAPHGRLVARER
jgi:hypothetical protein